MHVITYPFRNLSQTMLVKAAPEESLPVSADHRQKIPVVAFLIGYIFEFTIYFLWNNYQNMHSFDWNVKFK